MQLKNISIIASLALASTNVLAQDYINFEVLHYAENDSRINVTAPSLEINKDFGTDYTLNFDLVADSVSGASPTYYDVSSGASAYSRGEVSNISDIKKGNINFDEQRVATSVNLTKRFESRDELKTGFAYSSESDFYSGELSSSYLHYLDASHNKSVNFGGSYQYNEILIKNCEDNSFCDASSGASKKMTNDVYNLQVGYSQVIDQTSVASIGLFYTNENGYLSSPYHNVVRNFSTIVNEVKPDTKAGYGIKAGLQKAFGDQWSSNINYKYYTDDWGIDSHTLDAMAYYEFTDKIIFGGGIRYYTQSEADFYGENFSNEAYASSDERVSEFSAITYKGSFDYQISASLGYNFGVQFYDQDSGLSAISFMTGLKYKF